MAVYIYISFYKVLVLILAYCSLNCSYFCNKLIELIFLLIVKISD